MRDYFEQVAQASDAHLYYLALSGALMIPDMCAALDAEDGETSGAKYRAWFDAHAAGRFGAFLTGEECYDLRCKLLHQVRMHTRRGRYSRVLFIEPGQTTNVFHMNVINDALNIDVGLFVRDMLAAADEWLRKVEGTERYKTNAEHLMARHPNGIRPYIGGVAVIG